MKKWMLTLAAAACLTSCVYSFNPEIDPAVQKTLVVDGGILIGGTSYIDLTYLMPLSQKATGPAGALGQAWIEDINGTIYSSTLSGYSSSIAINTENAPRGLQYRAGVQVDGQTYYSEWLTAAPAPVIGNVSIESADDKVTVYVDANAQKSQTGYLGFSYEETWLFHADFAVEVEVNPENWQYSDLIGEYPYYWCWTSRKSPQKVIMDYSSLDGSQVSHFGIKTFSRSDSRNHRRYSILIRAFSLSRDAYLYNKQLQDLSNIGGDLFSPEPGSMAGNLRCESDPERPVMGLVLASEVESKRVFMGNEFLWETAPDESILRTVEQEEMDYYYYNKNYRPVKYVATENGRGVGWAPHRCINCLEAGGSQERPPYWED